MKRTEIGWVGLPTEAWKDLGLAGFLLADVSQAPAPSLPLAFGPTQLPGLSTFPRVLGQAALPIIFVLLILTQ